MILRPGYITKEQLEAVIGEVKTDPGIIAADSAQRPKAPGMKYRHYAPKASLTVVEGSRQAVIEKINILTGQMQAEGKKVGVIATDETGSFYRGDMVVSAGARADEAAIARHLYRILRDFDAAEADVIYSESFEAPGIGQAVMNRLLKAAGHQVIRV